jgi:hypothetical protein
MHGENFTSALSTLEQRKKFIQTYVQKCVVFELNWQIMFKNKYHNYVIFHLQQT